MLEITIPMRPVSKERPRFVNGHTYTPEKTKRAEDAIAWAVKAHMLETGISIMETAVSIQLEFSFKLAKSVTKKARELLDTHNLPHIQRPDLDNLCKLCLDSLNGIAYLDDKQIVHLETYKLFGAEDYIKITIRSLA